MQQAPRLENVDTSLVCRLNNALYRLKQAPGAWFERLTQALKGFGFVSNRCDPSLFDLITPAYIIYMLVYVDDIIITRNYASHIQPLVIKLQSQFSLNKLVILNTS